MELTNTFSSANKYDVQGALSEGYTLEDIGKDAGFDVMGARSEGYTDEEIISHLQGDTSQSVQGEVSVGEPQIMQLPTNENVDTKTTTPMLSTPVFGNTNDPTSALVSTDFPQYSKDQVMQAIAEHRNATQDYYIDPGTGEKKVSTRISGAAEPTYDILPGGGAKLGIFGIEAAIAAGKVTPEIAQGVSEAFAAARPGLQDMAFDKSISPAAKLLLARRIDVSDDEAINILQGIPTNEQALTLARALGEHGYIKQAVKAEGDKEAGQLLNIIKSPSGEVKAIVGEPDIQAAKDKYSAMSAAISSEGTANVRPVPRVSAKLNQLLSETYLVPNSAQSVALRLKGAIDRNNGNLSLPDAVDYMPELNSLIMKARNHNERAALQDIKSTIDDTITSLATPEQRKMFDDAVSTYSRTMQNKETLDIVKANTKEGIGTNWTKVHRELADANLRSPEAVDALRVTEAFATKYGNDSKLVQTARAAGSSPDSGGALGAYGFLVNHLKDIFATAGMKIGVETNRGVNLKIQKDIIKAIRKGKTDSEFVQNIRDSRNIPDDVKEQIVDIFEPKQITYNPAARQTGDVSLNPIVTPVGGTTKIDEVILGTTINEVVNDTFITRQISKLENLVPSNSYIKPEDFSKYKPDISRSDEAYLHLRQSTGYLNDAKNVKLTNEEIDLIRDLYKSYTDLKLSTNYDYFKEKYKNSKVLREVFDGELPEQFGLFRSELDEYLSDGYSQTLGAAAHDRASTILDKDLYVTKSKTTDKLEPGLVSTFAVSPKDLVKFDPGDKNTMVYKVPKGSKVTFVDRGERPLEGSTGRAEEVVLDSKYLKEAPNKLVDTANKAKESIKQRYTYLILLSRGIKPSEANKMVYVDKYLLDEEEYNKLYSSIPILGATQLEQNQQNE